MGYRQRGGSWEVNVAHKGERRFATVPTEELAKEKEVELKAELIRLARAKEPQPEVPVQAPAAVPAAPQSWTLGEAIKSTFTNHWDGMKSAWWYKLKCRELSAYFGDEKWLHEIDTGAVDKFREACKARGWSQATINHHLAALSRVFKTAHQRGGVAMKPVLGIKKARRVRKRWVTEQEEKVQLALLTQWKKPEQWDWYVVMIDTGMRPEETKQMTGAWCDFRELKDADGKVISNGSVHVQVSKTDAGIRSIPMTKRVRAVLERRCLTHKLGRLFPLAWDRFTNQWDATRKAMGLEDDTDFVPYCLRHTFATRLLQRGEDLEVVSKLMGHSSLDQTMEYAKLAAAQFVAAIRRLEPEPT